MRYLGILLLALVGCSVPPTPLPSPHPSPAERARVLSELLPAGDAPLEVTPQLQALQEAQGARALQLAGVLEKAATRSSDLSDLLAGFYRRAGAPDRALPLARQAVALSPSTPRALLHLGQLEQELGYSAAAGEHLRKARELAPDTLPPHLALASFLERELHYPEAEQALREAVALDPQNPGVLGALAGNLIAQQRFDDAKKILEQADRFAPDAPPGLLQRAQIAWEEARRNPGAPERHHAELEKWLQLCLRVAPGHPAALYSLGNLRLVRGNLPGGVRALEEAHLRAPDLDGLKIQLGQALVRQGQKARGMALLQEHRRAQEHRETRDRLVSRVAMAPENRTYRQALIQWCLTHGEAARARLEQAELAAQGSSRTER